MHKSCYGCYYEVSRKCYWFTLVGNSRTPKAIPSDTINKGCSKYENTEMSGLEQHLHIIELFDGEIVSEKYEPPVRERKSYKKKYVKSAHNYSYRRDAQ